MTENKKQTYHVLLYGAVAVTVDNADSPEEAAHIAKHPDTIKGLDQNQIKWAAHTVSDRPIELAEPDQEEPEPVVAPPKLILS